MQIQEIDFINIRPRVSICARLEWTITSFFGWMFYLLMFRDLNTPIPVVFVLASVAADFLRYRADKHNR